MNMPSSQNPFLDSERPALAAAPEYFVNHERASRFPWSLYHAPISKSLVDFVGHLPSAPPQRGIVIGPGEFFELKKLPLTVELTLVDIDARVLERLKRLQDSRIRECHVVAPDSTLRHLPGGPYDFVIAKEVIEHIENPGIYLNDLFSTMKSTASFWFSTPNYGEPWLPTLEKTVLEWIARRSGFSRKHIHPTKFSQKTLHTLLSTLGAQNLEVHPIAYRMALVATGQLRSSPHFF